MNNTVSQQTAATVSVVCTPEVYALTSKWAAEYSNQFPERKILVKSVESDDLGGILQTGDKIGFISNEVASNRSYNAGWEIVVGRDVIVPVMNPGNPIAEEIKQNGVSAEIFARMFNNPENRSWGNFPGKTTSIPLHIYMVEDELVKSGLAKFLGIEKLPMAGITLVKSEEMALAIQKDPLAIGFCKVNSILDPVTQNIATNVHLLPIDKNGNGKLDYMENIYADANTFMRGVWIGKYPKALNSEISSISNIQPSNENEIAFMKWVLTEGQRFLNPIGYSELVTSERQTQLEKLSIAQSIETASTNNYFIIGLVLLGLAGLMLLGFIVNAFFWNYKNRKTPVQDNSFAFSNHFDENSVEAPAGLYYDKTHTWAFMEKNGFVKIGIDDFLQHITGPITRIEMKNTGEKINKGEAALSIIQNGKQLRIYSPVTGIIKEHNTQLNRQSSMLNLAPYSDGWIYSIEPSNWMGEIRLMLMSDKYQKWIVQEFSRLKDVFAKVLKTNTVEYSLVVMQDGGALKDNILSEMGPEVWEDFQTHFIDTSR